MVATLLGVAAILEAQPGYARFLVFPLVLAGWLISLCVHEFGHAVAAYASGDRSMRDNGYLTLDPLRYTDLQFSIVWPLVIVAMGGIGLPGGAVYVNMRAIRSPLHRSLVSAAGPLATLGVLILLLVLLRAAGNSISIPFYAALAFLAFLQLTALVLNLLPIPGLDGWGVIEPWLPGEFQEFGARFAGIAPALLFMVFLLVPAANVIFRRVVNALSQIIGLEMEGVGWGFALFQFWR